MINPILALKQNQQNLMSKLQDIETKEKDFQYRVVKLTEEGRKTFC